ncbi:MAG: SulA-like leucine-rich domain-containing protein [Pseudomonadota bacterium]
MNSMLTFNQNTHPNPSHAGAAAAPSWAGETVIIELPHDYNDGHPGELDLLLPKVSVLMRNERRWLAWIAPPFRITSDRLAEHEISPTSLLQIHPGHSTQHFRLVRRALATGRCGVVMAWTHHCAPEEIEHLRDAAAMGQSVCILLVHAAESSHPELDFNLRLRADAGSNDHWFEVLASTPFARELAAASPSPTLDPIHVRGAPPTPLQLSIF